MTRLLATASVTALLACTAPAWAQSNNQLKASGPIAPAANAKNDAASRLPTADQAFVEKAAKGGMAEVELGRIAQEKASDQEVKELAQLIVREHEQANQQLMAIAQAKGLTQLGGLDGKHLEVREKLQTLGGAEFDRMYVEGQVADHIEAVALFEQQAQSGQDQELKRFASEVLPKIQAHTEHLKQVAQKMGGASGTQAATAATGAAATAAAASSDMTGATSGGGMRAEDIVAMTAYAASGEQMGEVEDVIVDPSTGQLTAALIEFGGFLGIGSKKVAVDWDHLEIRQDDRQVVVNMSREDLEAAPEYRDDDDMGAGGVATPATPTVGTTTPQQ